MFTGTVESRSHEGGLLVHFKGSSPALNAIMVRADDGVYVGKVDGVLGSTDRPLAHVAHIDRSLNMDELIGVQLKIRAKVQREQRNDRRGSRDERPQRRFDNDRRGGRDNDRRGGRDYDRRGGRDNDRRGGRYDNDRRGGRDNQRSGNQRQFNNDWTCPKCNNSNFAFREACNRCEAPRPSGGRQQRSNDRYDNDRRGGRDNRSSGRFGNDRRGGRNNRSGGRYDNDRRGGRQQRDTFNTNDWTCPKCNNSNFSFRQACNRCDAPRPGGGGGGGQQRNNSGGYRKSGQNGGFGNRRDGGRDNRNQSGGRGRQERNNNDRTYRKARGKRSGHAHNQPPRDFRTPRKFERKDD
ncbi:MAG: hypothetical protein CMA86_01320 [Euryarchaeota archaeon]|nr:hypothetical protein [Euryarchaeota archaeon]